MKPLKRRFDQVSACVDLRWVQRRIAGADATATSFPRRRQAAPPSYGSYEAKAATPSRLTQKTCRNLQPVSMRSPQRRGAHEAGSMAKPRVQSGGSHKGGWALLPFTSRHRPSSLRRRYEGLCKRRRGRKPLCHQSASASEPHQAKHGSF